MDLKFLAFLLCCLSTAAFAQTLGGSAAYNFLKLPATSLLTAAGGANVSYSAGDVSTAVNNPALLSANLHAQANVSFNAFLGDAKAYSLAGAWHSNKRQTTFGGHIYFVDYGSIPATDAAGNVSGSFRPVEYAVQFSAAKKYLERWTYGGTLKFIQSSYGVYTSNAIAVDVGLVYNDSAHRFSAGLLAKNMGAQLKSFAGEKEDLPFDLQVGLTQCLSKAPFGFSLTAHHLHRYNIAYDDKVFNGDNGFSSPSSFDKVFTHFVVATHVYLGTKVEATVGYNHLRRTELGVPGTGNGLTGFSAGLHARFSKLQVQFARSSYQKGVAYNQLGITVHLDKFGGLGK